MEPGSNLPELYRPSALPAAYAPVYDRAAAPGAGTGGGWLWRAACTAGPPSIAPLAILAASYSASAGGAAHSAGDAAAAVLVGAAAAGLGVALRGHRALAGTCLGVAGAAAQFGIGAYTTNPGLRIGWALVACAVAASLARLLGQRVREAREQRAARLEEKHIEASATVTVAQITAGASVQRTQIKENARTAREAIRAQTAVTLGYDPHAAVTAPAWSARGLSPERRALFELSAAARDALADDPATVALLAPAWGAGDAPRHPAERPAGPAPRDTTPGNYL